MCPLLGMIASLQPEIFSGMAFDKAGSHSLRSPTLISVCILMVGRRCVYSTDCKLPSHELAGFSPHLTTEIPGDAALRDGIVVSIRMIVIKVREISFPPGRNHVFRQVAVLFRMSFRGRTILRLPVSESERAIPVSYCCSFAQKTSFMALVLDQNRVPHRELTFQGTGLGQRTTIGMAK
jgi:hypothetical protein